MTHPTQPTPRDAPERVASPPAPRAEVPRCPTCASAPGSGNREVLELHLVHGLTPVQIAALCGGTRTEVECAVRDALRLLRLSAAGEPAPVQDQDPGPAS